MAILFGELPARRVFQETELGLGFFSIPPLFLECFGLRLFGLGILVWLYEISRLE